jgi:hypothetical protein
MLLMRTMMSLQYDRPNDITQKFKVENYGTNLNIVGITYYVCITRSKIL